MILSDLTMRQTLDTLSKVAGLNAPYFCRMFKRVTGIKFTDWNARVRVDEAKRLLGLIDMPITVVGASVGYPDLTSFERVFKRYESMSPREYRRLLTNGLSEGKKRRM